MDNYVSHQLQPGIISVLQTPFQSNEKVDYESLNRLIEDAIDSGVNGFLVPAVASEVEYLSNDERDSIVRHVVARVAHRVPVVVGASTNDAGLCQQYARLATELRADAYLVAIPNELYHDQIALHSFFQQVASCTDLPLVIQDLQWNGPGLDLQLILKLREKLPTLIGLKIETIPAGPKYTAVRQQLGDDFFIAGGWAVPQWIEALDRGIDAMIPESAMIGVYAEVLRLYQNNDREAARRLFQQLLPILAFTNQEIGISIAFFKLLLVRRGVFKHDGIRMPGFAWDEYNSRIADELIELYLELEKQVKK